MALVEVVPFLLREISSWHPMLTASATSASLVEVCEFWAVHCTGQQATGNGPHGPDAALLLLLKEGPASLLLRFGARRPSTVDLVVFAPGQSFVQVGRLGYDRRTHALDPLIASISTGAWLSAAGRHPFLVPRPPGFGTIVSRCGESMALVRPQRRHSGAVHGCPRCTLAAAAGSQVHNLHSRPATCQDIAAAITSDDHPQAALLAIALQLCQGTLELQAFHRLQPGGHPAVAPEVGLVAFCAPLASAGPTGAEAGLPPVLPPQGPLPRP